jgi:hypothetical protein
MFDMSHLDKEPTRVVCYHGSAVFGIERLDTGERRIGVRDFGHQPTNEGDEIDPTSEVIEIVLTADEAMEFMIGIMAGYEGTVGEIPTSGGSPN